MKHVKRFFDGKEKDIKLKIEYSTDNLINAIRRNDLQDVEKIASINNINKHVAHGSTPLNFAIYKGDYNIVNKLIEKGADINLPAKESGISPLIQAARLEEYRIMLRLLNLGADINHKNDDGKDFIDNLDLERVDDLNSKYIKMFKIEYPKLYDEYLIRKDINKYNL